MSNNELFDNLIEAYENSKQDNSQDRETRKLRYSLLRNLLQGNSNVLDNSFFLDLLKEEIEDISGRKFVHSTLSSKFILSDRVSMIITLTQACKTRGDDSEDVLDNVSSLYDMEFCENIEYSRFIAKLMDWIWKEINGSADLDKTSSKKSVFKYASTYLDSLKGFEEGMARGLGLPFYHKTLLERYEDVYAIEGLTSARIDTIYGLLIMAFIHYKEEDLTDFKYYLMKAHMLNLPNVQIELVIELLVNQFLLD